MTREEQLIAMNGTTLIMLADKLGVKVKCNRTRTALKEAKKAVVDRILAVENAATEDKLEDQVKPADEDQVKPTDETQPADEIQGTDEAQSVDEDQDTPPAELEETEAWEDDSYEDRKKQAAEADKAAEDAVNNKPADRKSKKIKELTYDGRTQSIKDWALELGMPYPTLYDRINRNGWSVEEAIEIPLGERRPR